MRRAQQLVFDRFLLTGCWLMAFELSAAAALGRVFSLLRGLQVLFAMISGGAWPELWQAVML